MLSGLVDTLVDPCSLKIHLGHKVRVLLLADIHFADRPHALSVFLGESGIGVIDGAAELLGDPVDGLRDRPGGVIEDLILGH